MLGVLSMIAAAVAGLADYTDTDGTARTRATTHATLMVVALLVYVVSLAIRAGAPSSRGLPIALSIVGFLILTAGAFVGGDVVYRFGNMVNRHAWRGGGAKWLALEIDGGADLAEGTLTKAKLGINTLVLIRQGETVLRAPRPVRPRRRAAVAGHARGRVRRMPVARLAVPARPTGCSSAVRPCTTSRPTRSVAASTAGRVDGPRPEAASHRSVARAARPLRHHRTVNQEIVVPAHCPGRPHRCGRLGQEHLRHPMVHGFRDTSSDAFRATVGLGEDDQSATGRAFAHLHRALAERLAGGGLAIVDATNIGSKDRRALIRRANDARAQAVAIVLDMTLAECLEGNARRPAGRLARRGREAMDSAARVAGRARSIRR